ncbi:secretory carrier-associated membrane protein 3 isoform X2 [Serinus canaria]|uniref:secretory carrier-associated membrane protein 3 isoform X2 n=1 Tax=Serinus canaria TaxID=9135 RepID=UPI0021CCD80A|nr:secretory carrier-associated membrane protein 3 isoform X2 [Serinus canaria]
MAQRGGPAVLPDNPFQDPAALQARPGSVLDGYNPFESDAPPPPFQTPSVAPPPPVPAAAQPPRKASPTEPRNYGSYGSQASAAAATAELLKRQEELNRKAEELDRRERELQNAALGGSQTRLNNWPPLPSFCPVKPCFYQDIPVEIPADFQKTVTTMYYLWMASTIALFMNFLSSLAWFCVDPSSGSGFGLSILWALLYTPCSFVCWYRPMYKAFRSDSSFNFFVFFFVFFAQNVMYVLQAIGIPNWGFSGWILSLIALRTNTAVAVMMILVSLSFTAVAVLGIIMLKKPRGRPALPLPAHRGSSRGRRGNLRKRKPESHFHWIPVRPHQRLPHPSLEVLVPESSAALYPLSSRTEAVLVCAGPLPSADWGEQGGER